MSKIVGEPFHSRCEPDIHADTTVSGKNCAIIKYKDLSFDVAPFSEKYTHIKDILTKSAATGFKSTNGRNYISVIHEVLYMPDKIHTLINMNLCRHFGAKVQENIYH